MCHAALNAILNRNAESLEGCTLYTTLFPGHDDAKMIMQSGIKKIVYFSKRDVKYTHVAEEVFKASSRKVLQKRYPVIILHTYYVLCALILYYTIELILAVSVE